jgi:hypothetical protein
MNRIKTILTSLLLVFAFTTVSEAQLKKLAQSGFQFLKIDVGARASSMAGAMTLSSYDANTVFYNPAGLGRMNMQFDFMANNTQWIADIQYNAIAGAYNAGDLGTFGLHFLFVDYGEIIGTRVAQNDQGFVETGNVDVGAYSLGLSYSRNLSEQFTIGGTVKFVSQKLGSNLMPNESTKENSASGISFDFGTIFYPGWESFRFGMSVRNFGAELEYEQESFELPLTFTAGVAMNVFDLSAIEDQTLLISLDVVHSRDYTERISLGAEYILYNMIALRGGYNSNHDIESFSAGLGMFYEFTGLKVKVDYSYSAMKYFDGVNRFTVGFSF